MHRYLSIVVKRRRLAVPAAVALVLLLGLPLGINHVNARVNHALISLVANIKPVTAGPAPHQQIVRKIHKANRTVVLAVTTAKKHGSELYSVTATVRITLATSASSTKVFSETFALKTVDHATARIHATVGRNVTTHRGSTTYIDTPVAAKVTTRLGNHYRATGRLHTTVTASGAVRVELFDAHRV